MLAKLTIASVRARKLMAGLTVFSIAVSMFVLFSVEHLRTEVRANFERAVSGVDLIVGARTSQLNLLLYSVFHIGSPSSNIPWQAYQGLKENKSVEWAVPISLGDSHEGFAVVGTSEVFFSQVKYGAKHDLSFAQGTVFTSPKEVVLGAKVAAQLSYDIGQQLVLSHGTGKVSFTQHAQYPFVVVGVLDVTGTPIDQSLFVPVASIDAMHGIRPSLANKPKGQGAGSKSSIEHPSHTHDSHTHDSHSGDKQGPELSAVLLGLTSKISTLQVQRRINTEQSAPMSAIIPGVALAELWSLMNGVEVSLSLVSSLILVAAMLGMLTMLLASMHERQKEIAVLRALGASAWLIVVLIECEAVLLTLLGCLLGYGMTNTAIWLLSDMLQSEFGLLIGPLSYASSVVQFSSLALGLAFLLALGPGLAAYKGALSNGLTVR